MLVTIARKTRTDSWGLNVGQTEAESGALHVVSRIVPGGPSDGKLYLRDVIKYIYHNNNKNVLIAKDMTHAELVETIRDSGLTLMLTVVRINLPPKQTGKTRI